MTKKNIMAPVADGDPFADVTNVATQIVEQMKSEGSSSPSTQSTPSITVEKTKTGAAAGCKPGSTRHTYVMPLEMIDKLKAIAGYFGKAEVGIVLEILDKGITEYENKFGKQVSSFNRSSI